VFPRTIEVGGRRARKSYPIALTPSRSVSKKVTTLLYYVADGERSGRPKEISDEVEEGQLADVRGSRSDISLASCAYL
jgi:hypothetical protein